MKRVFVSLGGNIGDVKNTLSAALGFMAKLQGLHNLHASRLYYTSPVGVKDQPYYHNCVACFDYENKARELLLDLQQIEQRLGRVRLVPYGSRTCDPRTCDPRTCDIDILLFGDDQIDEKELQVPHPRMYERLFVLIPLLELLPHEERVRSAITNLQKTDTGTVVPVFDATWSSLCVM